jgi:predicted GH43/DUF377 family glycosyl hydrolase
MADWLKRGLVFVPRGEREWMRSHASNPVALPIGDDLVRVYFSSRDGDQRSHVGFLEFDPREPGRIVRLAEAPVLAPGPLGHFDDSGTYAMSLVPYEGRLRMYYVGWNRGAPPLYYTAIGLAESSDGGETFERVSAAPIMARSDVDPWMVSSPYVMLDDGRWRMWYLSGLGWREDAGELHSYYHTKYAESDDGVSWRREGHVALELAPGERNIARMCVVRDPDGYLAWYSAAGEHRYRIGHARSVDGVTWVRRDSEAGIDVSPSGWDSEEMAYPWVFDFAGTRWMLYCGNGVGRAGFGLAELA